MSWLSPEAALGLAVALPVGIALAVAFLGRWPNARDSATFVGSVITFAVVVFGVLPAVRDGGRPRLDLLEVLPGLPLALSAEPLGVIFALVASGLYVATGVYAVGYLRAHHEENQTRFFICFALAIFGALGVALSANLFTLFVFYELITLSTFPLVTHDGTSRAKKAGRLYLGILMGTSVALMLPAIVWTSQVAGTTDFRVGGLFTDPGFPGSRTGVAVLFALFVFGTAKAATMPFHRWLPAAMVAPTPVSALLHAVAVVKAGVFTVTKVVVYVFGLDLLAATGAAQPIQWITAFTLLSAAIVACTRENLKSRLAYSTISQLAYIVLGASLVTERAVVGAGLHLVMHAVGKITLFFCAGAIYVHAHKANVEQMYGLGRRMPITFVAFFLGSLSVIGIPPLGGSWSKLFLATGGIDGDAAWAAGVYMLGSLLAIAYLMPIVARGFLSLPAKDDAFTRRHGIDEADWRMVVPLALTALGCIVLFFTADHVVAFLGQMFTGGTS